MHSIARDRLRARLIILAMLAIAACTLIPRAHAVQAVGGPWTALDYGGFHGCGLTDAGGVRCWGQGSSGQLGNGATQAALYPVPVSGLDTGITQIALGGSHTCALTDAGGVKCWGGNLFGQLGDGTTTSPQTAPVNVIGLSSGVEAITASHSHTCALLATGTVKCWGSNGQGQLGNNSTISSPSPVDVSALTGVASIDSGGQSFGEHTCAVLETGGLKCWGANFNGQLGDGSTTLRTSPVDVNGMQSNVASVHLGGDHTCARMTDGTARCWGLNTSGQLGDGTTTLRNVPVEVPGLAGATALATGGAHTCALLAGGTAKCWGTNTVGQLGNGLTTGNNVPNATPVNVLGVDAAVAISAGSSATCVVMADGDIECFGSNSNGGLGIGRASRSLVPRGVGTSPVVPWEHVSLFSGSDHSCAISSVGGVYCWGLNATGQLGDGTTLDAPTPQPVVGLSSGVESISLGSGFTCALLTGGAARCWGANSNGQLGDGTTTNSSVPVTVTGIGPISQISAGGEHTCALSGGSAMCWGRNNSGQLGSGNFTNSLAPVQVSTLTSGVLSISSGSVHTCAVITGGAAKCWGEGSTGRLGAGASQADQPTPVDPTGLASGVEAISASLQFTCAIVNSAVQCWGANSTGQLGNGTTANTNLPGAVSGLPSGVTQLTTGANHTCALIGTVLRCWGNNSNGQLGDGSAVTSSLPVLSSLTSVVKVSAGPSHTCAVDSNAVISCWGNRFNGQLGDGQSGYANTPVRVLTDVQGCDILFDAVDVLAILRSLANLPPPLADAPCAPDFDGDGDVDLLDALSLRRIIAGLPIS